MPLTIPGGLMFEPTLKRLIEAVAPIYSIPPWTYKGMTMRPYQIIAGMVLSESRANPQAYRYEKHQDAAGRADAARDQDRPGIDDKPWEDDASYGLMQVMGYNIKQLCGVVDKATGVILPVKMDFSFAFAPVEGLRLGCEWFSKVLRSSDGDVATALARYNGGHVGNPFRGPFRTQAYIDRTFEHVQSAMESW